MREGLVAEFRTLPELLGAIARLRELGYRRIDAHTPFPAADVERALGLGRSRLPWAVLVAGIAGALSAYLLQYYLNAVNFPLDAGGRPGHAPPAFVPITFETTVLLAALTAFIGVLALAGLPRLWHPAFESPGFARASLDTFWLSVDAADQVFDRATAARELDALGASEITFVGGAR